MPELSLGSKGHKELFCRSFIESHNQYEPDRLPWPELGGPDLERLRAVPFWEEVLHTEQAAGAKVEAYAATIRDPLLQEAIALQGIEESRHARLLQFMIQHYGIKAAEQPLDKLPADIETTFINFGYGECVDAFLGFGVFKIARQSGFLPEPMFAIFDHLMHEETRHIVFFINWMARREVSRGRGAKGLRAATSLWFYGKAIQRLVSTVRRGANSNGQDFSATQASVFLDGFNVKTFLENCLQENKRRMQSFDHRLLQPRMLPALAHVALSSLRLWPGGRIRAQTA